MAASRCTLPVVTVCVSAPADLEALRRFFRGVPVAGLEAAFLVIPPAAAASAAPLVELLLQETQMPVREAPHGTSLERGHVYVTPPGHLVGLENEQLEVNLRDSAWSMDACLRHLASSAGQRAAVVLLSGSGPRGLEDWAEIEAALGLVIALDPGSVDEGATPSRASEDELVDLVLAPESIPACVGEWAQSAARTARGMDLVDSGLAPSDAALEQIRAALARRTGHDFSSYRRSWFLRCIERRQRIHGLESFDAYARLLDARPTEVDALERQLLIGVTEFFRDPEVFSALEALLAERLASGRPEDPLRIWVPACSTGEEAYSMAMLAEEAAERLGQPPAAGQVFGSDVHARAIARARRGWFREDIARQLPPSRRARFLQRDEAGFTIHPRLRERVVFAVHDLLRDPPFARMDVISCRNLLVYLGAEAQRLALQLFHRALRPGGLLVLGKAEWTEALEGAFTPLEPGRSIYRRVDSVTFPVPVATSFSFRELPKGAPRAPSAASGAAHDGEVYRWLADAYAPASVLVTAAGDLLHVHGRTGHLLELPEGRTSSNVLELARKGLREALEVVLRELEQQPARTVAREARIAQGPRSIRVRVVAHALTRPRSSRGEVMICFEPLPARARSTGKDRDLEIELRGTRAELQSSVDQIQATNEELVARNEELLSTNDELSSTNEVLNASRAEIKLLNDRLQMANGELSRIEHETRLALLRTRAILDAAFDGVLSADVNGTIELVNPALCALFGYEEQELVGACLTDLVPALRVPESGDSGSRGMLASVARDLKVVGQRKNGETVPILLSLVEVRDAGRRTLMGTLRDLSIEEQLQRSLLEEARAAAQAEELERRKLASELHDDLGQTLALACMKLGALGPIAGAQTADVEAIETLVRKATERIESLTSELSPPILRDLGLVAALEWLAEDMERRCKLRVQVLDDGEDKPLDAVTREVLFRAVRELLIDVARHPGVQHARIRIQRWRDALRVEVDDDGSGMDLELQRQALRLGFARERLRNLGGSLRREPARGGGTRAIAEVPLHLEREMEGLP